MPTKLSQKDTKSFLENGFFNNWEITSSFKKEEVGLKLNDKTEDPKGIKVKIKWKKPGIDYISTGFVVGITQNEELEVIEEQSETGIKTIDPKWIVGVFFTTLGREIEIGFGVGRSSITSLLDE